MNYRKKKIYGINAKKNLEQLLITPSLLNMPTANDNLRLESDTRKTATGEAHSNSNKVNRHLLITIQ